MHSRYCCWCATISTITLTVSSPVDAHTEVAAWRLYLRPDTTRFSTTDKMWSKCMPGPRRTARATWRPCVWQKPHWPKSLRRGHEYRKIFLANLHFIHGSLILLSPPPSALQAAVSAHSALHSSIPASSEASLTALWLGRACRTASHELDHCFGIDHCIYYARIMQGSASPAEDVRQPP
jgi:hypothetical protein